MYATILDYARKNAELQNTDTETSNNSSVSAK